MSQLVELLLNVHKALGKLVGMVIHTCVVA